MEEPTFNTELVEKSAMPEGEANDVEFIFDDPVGQDEIDGYLSEYVTREEFNALLQRIERFNRYASHKI